jgi:ubiquinol-cytochrome c reductase iron-sulfur subunit
VNAQPDPTRRVARASPRAELAVVVLLVLAALAGVGFVVAFVLGANTQLIGLSLGLALAFLAAACVVAADAVFPRETAVEERPRLVHEEDEREVARELRATTEGVSRRRLIAAAAGVAGVGLAGAIALPVTALGPSVDDRLDGAPWRRGRRLVDHEGRPMTAADIEDGSFATAFPEGADQREMGSPVVVIRVPQEGLRLPPGRESWAPGGIMAFSKICTHAGCAIALFRWPLYEPTSKPPALVCPCHYSTFDVEHGGEVVFGPAVRALPQLPLAIDGAGNLVANGGFSGSVGPSWWGSKGG